MTIFSDQASDAATRAPEAIDMERHATRQRVLQLIDEGRPGRAQYELARSVQRQARIAGLGTQEIAPACPCGRGCPR